MSGTVTALGTAALGLAACVAIAGLGQAAAADARASGAADLAALAAADAQRGAPGGAEGSASTDAPQAQSGPCALAAQVAERNGARLDECTVEDGGSVRVTVLSERPLGITARTVSRAGPPAASPDPRRAETADPRPERRG